MITSSLKSLLQLSGFGYVVCCKVVSLLINFLFLFLFLEIHDKNIVAILHLLTALARHFDCPQKLPAGVNISMVVVQKKGGILLPQKVVEEITEASGGEG